MSETTRRGVPSPRGSGAARGTLAALAAAVALTGAGCAPAGGAWFPSSSPAAAAPSSSASPAPVASSPAPGDRPDVGSGTPRTGAGVGPGNGDAAGATEAGTPAARPGSTVPRAGGVDVPVASAALRPAAPVPAPVRLSYEAIGADVPVVPTGVARDGQMDIPEDAATAGWYRFGPAPAAGRGHTVVAAHAGSVETPRGPLYALREAAVGDVVRLWDEDGTEHRYRVSTVEQLGKDGLDFTPYFARTGPARLVLVTCGGEWRAERESYADNVIVVAEPVP